MSTVTVRAAELADIERITPMYEWLFAPPGSRPVGWDPRRAVERLGRAVRADSSVVLIATLGDKLVGFCTAYDELESVRWASAGVR